MHLYGRRILKYLMQFFDIWNLKAIQYNATCEDFFKMKLYVLKLRFSGSKLRHILMISLVFNIHLYLAVRLLFLYRQGLYKLVLDPTPPITLGPAIYTLFARLAP